MVRAMDTDGSEHSEAPEARRRIEIGNMLEALRGVARDLIGEGRLQQGGIVLTAAEFLYGITGRGAGRIPGETPPAALPVSSSPSADAPRVRHKWVDGKCATHIDCTARPRPRGAKQQQVPGS